MRLLICVCVAAIGACSDDTPASVDARLIDSSGSGGPCTGAVYDPCTTNDQCMSNNCHFYMMSNFTVCVTNCTPGDNTTCPVDSSGANGFCNNMGMCKPAMPNSCTR